MRLRKLNVLVLVVHEHTRLFSLMQSASIDMIHSVGMCKYVVVKERLQLHRRTNKVSKY